MPVKDKYTACLVFQDEDCEKNFRKVLDQKDNLIKKRESIQRRKEVTLI